MVEVDQLEAGGRGGQPVFQPVRLLGGGAHAIWLVAVAVNAEESHEPSPKHHVIVALVIGERKVVEIRLVAEVPVVVPEGWPESVGRAARTIRTFVITDETVVVLADILVNGRG